MALPFMRPQFCAVAHQNLDQIALRLDDRTLFDDEHGHQSVGKQEHHREQRHKGAFLYFGTAIGITAVEPNKVVKVATPAWPHKGRHRGDCSLSANEHERPEEH